MAWLAPCWHNRNILLNQQETLDLLCDDLKEIFSLFLSALLSEYKVWDNWRSTSIWLRSGRNTCWILDKILNGIGRSRQSGRIYQLWVTALHLLQHGQEATKVPPRAARPVLGEPIDLYHIESYTWQSLPQHPSFSGVEMEIRDSKVPLI